MNLDINPILLNPEVCWRCEMQGDLFRFTVCFSLCTLNCFVCLSEKGHIARVPPFIVPSYLNNDIVIILPAGKLT